MPKAPKLENFPGIVTSFPVYPGKFKNVWNITKNISICSSFKRKCLKNLKWTIFHHQNLFYWNHDAISCKARKILGKTKYLVKRIQGTIVSIFTIFSTIHLLFCTVRFPLFKNRLITNFFWHPWLKLIKHPYVIHITH